MTLSWNCCIYYPSVALAATVIITSFPTLPPHGFLSITLSVSRSRAASNLSATVSKPTKRYVCHTFTTAICQNRSPIVARDTSFKSSCWLIEFAYEAFIYCQTLTEKRAKSSLVNLSRKSTLGQTCTHTHRNTHTTIQRRGVWDIPQTASCSR